MTYGKGNCLVLSLLLAIATSGAPFQSRTVFQEPVFENGDFKIFSPGRIEELPSLSGESAFGVLVVSGNPATWASGKKCPYCFSGPTGRPSLLVFGTPLGVVSEAKKYSLPTDSPVWIEVRSNATITQELFKEDFPDAFQDSVREDLFAIGFLADATREGSKPSVKEQAHAAAGLNDLSFKGSFLSLYSKNSGEAPPVLIHVKVHTLRSGKEINRWTVYYVVQGWEDDQNHVYRFDRQSSPTEQDIPPGPYTMWASRNRKDGPRARFVVGDTPKPMKEVDLEIP